MGDWRVRWVVKAAAQVEGVVIVERLDRAATQVEDVEVVSPDDVGWVGRLRCLRGVVVVESTTETERVIVINIVGTVVEIGRMTLKEERSFRV